MLDDASRVRTTDQNRVAVQVVCHPVMQRLPAAAQNLPGGVADGAVLERAPAAGWPAEKGAQGERYQRNFPIPQPYISFNCHVSVPQALPLRRASMSLFCRNDGWATQQSKRYSMGAYNSLGRFL